MSMKKVFMALVLACAGALGIFVQIHAAVSLAEPQGRARIFCKTSGGDEFLVYVDPARRGIDFFPPKDFRESPKKARIVAALKQFRGPSIERALSHAFFALYWEEPENFLAKMRSLMVESQTPEMLYQQIPEAVRATSFLNDCLTVFAWAIWALRGLHMGENDIFTLLIFCAQCIQNDEFREDGIDDSGAPTILFGKKDHDPTDRLTFV